MVGASRRAAGAVHHASGSVLYIEDNASNIRLVERLIARRPGVTVRSAMTGAEGVEAAARERPDLILLDLHLPDMDGETVLARLASLPLTRHIPVAVLSADAVNAQSERLLAAGAVAYLTKPLEIARVFQLLDSRLGSTRGDP